MFKFLKEKLKGALDRFSKKAEEVAEPVKEEVQAEEKLAEKKSEVKKESKKTKVKEIKEESKLEKKPETEVAKEQKEVEPEIKEEKKGFFGRLKEKITTTQISEDKFGDLFWELELAMLENNVAVEIIEKMKDDLKVNLINNPIKRGEVTKIVQDSLRNTLINSFVEPFDVLDRIKNKKPYVACFFGINGAGKTTTIAKFVRMLQEKGLKVVLAASDTFRAAAIHQLEAHAERLGVKVIKQDYGSDPAAVAFDAIKHAEAKDIDVVLIDTAGRMHSNKNLVDEMKKIVRVSNPDLKIFIGESITGNDCVEQVKIFDEAVGIDGIILSKADVDEKGGAAVSVSYITKKPILYLGVGQEYKDLKKFDPQEVIKAIGL